MTHFGKYTGWNKKMTKHAIDRCEERLLPRGREAIKCIRDMRHLKVINFCALTRDMQTGRDAISLQSRNLLIVFCLHTGKIVTELWNDSVERLTAYSQQKVIQPISLKALKARYPSVLHAIRELLIDMKQRRRY